MLIPESDQTIVAEINARREANDAMIRTFLELLARPEFGSRKRLLKHYAAGGFTPELERVIEECTDAEDRLAISINALTLACQKLPQQLAEQRLMR